jgi:hypothetical protein
MGAAVRRHDITTNKNRVLSSRRSIQEETAQLIGEFEPLRAELLGAEHEQSPRFARFILRTWTASEIWCTLLRCGGGLSADCGPVCRGGDFRRWDARNPMC